MTNIFEGKLIRLRAIEPTDWEFFHRWDAESTDTARMTDEIWFPNSTTSAKDFAERESKPREGDFVPLPDRNARRRAGRDDQHALDRPAQRHVHVRTRRPPGSPAQGLRIRSDPIGAALLLRRAPLSEMHRRGLRLQPAVACSLHERLGFTLEGRLRRMIYSDGAFHDALIYGITREEFEEQGLSTCRMSEELTRDRLSSGAYVFLSTMSSVLSTSFILAANFPVSRVKVW